MSTSNDIAELLSKGIEAARAEHNSEARGYFERVVELDEKNEKGWFWLASVVESDEERRICLSNVLHINPNNERAKRALDALQAKAKEQKGTVAGEPEVVAGVSRRQMTLILGCGALAVIIILAIALTVIVGNNNREAAQRATAEAVALVATNGAETLIAAAAQASETSVAATATQQAQITPTVPTRVVPTLPPTWTPTPVATCHRLRQRCRCRPTCRGGWRSGAVRTCSASATCRWATSISTIGNQYTQIGNSYGKNISFSADGQRVAYTVYDQLLFGSSLEAINLNGTQIESLPERWRGQNVFEPQMPHYGGPFKQYVVFVARTDKRQSTQVFMLDLNPPQGLNPLAQLTDDETTYTDPVLSPDGKKVIAVKSVTNIANPTVDLVNIDVATHAQVPVTNDGESFTESSPTYTADGTQVVFAAVPSNEPDNSDIYIRNADGSGSTLPFYRGPANDVNPVLSPDGHYLAFASNPSGAYDIYVYDQSAATLSQLTNSPFDDFPGDWWQP